MNSNNEYLNDVLREFQPRDILNYSPQIVALKASLQEWANTCYVGILDSGSRAKGTAVSLASDVDYLVSLTRHCHDNDGGLKRIYNSLYEFLINNYQRVRKQNVSCRLNLDGLEVDITPGRRHLRNIYVHSLYVSKKDTWKRTNIQKHIIDISNSGRLKEIKLLKIWREINKLEFSSIYLEYLVVLRLLRGRPKDDSRLEHNLITCFEKLARVSGNPLNFRIVDPANSNNVLSDLLTRNDKRAIKSAAKIALNAARWSDVYNI